MILIRGFREESRGGWAPFAGAKRVYIEGREALVYSAKNDGSSCMPENPSGLHADEECWPGEKREESSLSSLRLTLSQLYTSTIERCTLFFFLPSFDPSLSMDCHDRARRSLVKLDFQYRKGGGKVSRGLNPERRAITRCGSANTVKLRRVLGTKKRRGKRKRKVHEARAFTRRFMWETDDDDGDEYRENHP